MKINLKFFIITVLLIIQSCKAQRGNNKVKFEWSYGVNPNAKYRYNIAASKNDRIYVIGGDNNGAFEAYNIKSNSWSILRNIPTTRIFSTGVILEQSFFVIGGIDSSNKYVTTVEKYNIIENEWTRVNDMKVARSRLSSIAYNENIYAIGGLQGTSDKDFKNSKVVEIYNSKTDSWTRKKDMPTARHGHSVVIYKNKILVIGGYTDSGKTGIVEEYNIDTDKWTKRASMPTPRGFFGLEIIDNYVYAIGGRVRQLNGPIEKYDYENNSWTQLESMPVWRNRFGIARYKNNIYIIGGENNKGGYTEKNLLIGKLKN